ncbi:ABC transporter permease [Enterococcus cecorum]|uniref:FtsX-like permease family protein n=3 Tax=Enterococcus cecorum TaxID=44008 RepID=UPI001FABCB0A|nr:ABC transporter permease [Enterococcus cecorum]MCJ0558690.1 ABC transporter permease [Enterococcus cecorum]MCJ0563343.1 ABC transporter permease [Enterococcus cecorum]MCJ0597553.1 ABC transporter permease [Enterococcus cecorum]
MQLKNNNQLVEKVLARRYYQQYFKLHFSVILSVVFSILLVYSSFSLVSAKFRSNELIDARRVGMIATISLENGSQTQYQQMQHLGYLKNVGFEKNVGKLTNESSQYQATYLDSVAFKNLYLPAWNYFKGHYPKKINEIMLSRELLNWLGINNPRISMEIFLSNQKFILSAYYTDYIDYSVEEPRIYVSKSYALKKSSLFPASKIVAIHDNQLTASEVQERLYATITSEYPNQQFFTENPRVMQSVNGLFGNYYVATAVAIIIVTCAGLLIYNMLSMIFAREYHNYCLLNVLGATHSQLRRISMRQMIKDISLGSIVGVIFAVVSVKALLSSLANKLFMQGFGDIGITNVCPLYLCIAINVTWTAAFIFAFVSLRSISHINAIKRNKCNRPEVTIKMARFCLLKLALQNIQSLGKRLFLVILSLSLSCFAVLLAIVLMKGTDLANRWNLEPDLKLGIIGNITNFQETEKMTNASLGVPQNVLQKIKNMDGIIPTSIHEVEGAYCWIDFEKDEALSARKESLENKYHRGFATLQIISKEEIKKIASFAKERELNFDEKMMLAGEGCILIHHQEMSPKVEELGRKNIHQLIHFYDLQGYKENDAHSYLKGELKNAGYFNYLDKEFPKLHITSMGNHLSYFLVSQEAFQRLGFSEQTFDVQFDVKKEKQLDVRQQVAKEVQITNKNIIEPAKQLYLADNMNRSQIEQNQRQTLIFLLSMLVVLLMIISLFNVYNTLAGEYRLRQRELLLLYQIGLSLKQLKKLLFLEGLIYWASIMVNLATVGLIILYGISLWIKQNLYYYRFTVPYLGYICLSCLLAIFIFAILSKTYDRHKRMISSLSDNSGELRNYTL